ncbi:ornithine-acyl[acyl carrier protein] N-acyltransferase [Aliiruegeria haliotis]|uniref:L-ornithine N(alpha)-acyltransferase n=1 Tax=Aliiruegeria haliotis TaxID=1280846 RepID=A0A2T0RL87_9RHOB|nr:GNAT family N-acyltransferase [Aliiruegeria haliotis]PRY21892.1 ornithine-acyl[acyl carrier protein] N-acyltransferase [Aliiruegeria haliotis]
MTAEETHFKIRLAKSEQDLLAAQRLRYDVFVSELGGDGDLVDHDGRFERDQYDAHYDHMILVDERRDAAALDHVVGVYRLLPGTRAAEAGGFYCASEYDLYALEQSGQNLLELGRSCVHADYRGGTALVHLWKGLGDYVQDHRIEVLFGVASFHGTDVQALAEPLSFLHHNHLAPEPLRVRALPEHFTSMDLLEVDAINRPAAVRAIPSLIKGYLRLGGYVGDGAFVDRAFNTTDVCLVLDTARVSEKQLWFYSGRRK